MTLAEIDRRLAEWKFTVDVIARNLVDLHNLPTYQKLVQSRLTGTTESRVRPALASLDETFQHFQLLVDTVKSASTLRDQVARSKTPDFKRKEIERLLTGQSIQLKHVSTPVTDRGLLTSPEATQWIAAPELVRLMTDAYAAAKNVVTEVDRCWDRLEWDVAALEASTGGEYKAIRDSIAADPLGALEAYDRAKAASTGAAERRNRVVDSLASARDLLKHLTSSRDQAEEAYRESLESIADPPALQVPIARAEVEALAQWLGTLESRFAEGLVDPVGIGVERWTGKARQHAMQTDRALAANRSPLETRRELRGRLNVLKAKALALGLAEDTSLTALAQTAENVLYSRPCSLAEAARAIAEFQSAIMRRQFFKRDST